MKIDPLVLDAIKGMDLPKLVQSYGIALKPAGKNAYQASCPFHDDKTPSLSIGFRNNKWIWNCFGCRMHGNTLDFRIAFEKLPFATAYQKCADELQLVPIESNGNGKPNGHFLPHAEAVNHAELLNRAAQVYHDTFLENARGINYLAGRGITGVELFRRHKIGFVNGKLRRMLPDDPNHESVVALKAAGILNEKGTERFYNCVVFPIHDGNGTVVGMYGRNIGGGNVEHLYLPGAHRGVWNAAAFGAYKEIILTESIVDALSLQVFGLSNAVALYGTNGLTEEHLRLMTERGTRRVLLCLDNDESGESARARVKEKITALGVDVVDVYLPRQYKDANEALKQGMPADEIKKVFTLESPNHSSAAAGGGPAVEEIEGSLHVAFGERRYRVKCSKTRALESLKAAIKVESKEGSYLDTVDLYSAKSRQLFMSACKKVIPVDALDLARELNQLVDILEARKMEGEETDEAAQEKCSPEEKAEALAALMSPTLLADILSDMERAGYVGEEHNKAIGYLVAVSRRMDDPLSCVITSQSAAGKSVLADTVEKLAPPEEVVSLSRATPQAFFYMAKGGLKHKLVVMEERVGAESADYAIRTLQSKKRLSQAVTLKDETTGEMKTKLYTVEGPVAYIETTTRPRIHEENATRSFELYLDESEAQTRRIHTRQRAALTLAGFEDVPDGGRLIRRHHQMQRLLRPVAVVTPYAPLIEFPTAWLRTRRDHPRFFNLIRVITFLHQHQRPVRRTADGREYIESTMADYRLAFDLARAVMGESFTDLKKPQRELLKAIEAMRAAEGLTRRAIREQTGLADTRLRELLADLVSLEYLRMTDGGGQGKLARYAVTERVAWEEKRLAGLTTPEELERKLASS